MSIIVCIWIVLSVFVVIDRIYAMGLRVLLLEIGIHYDPKLNMIYFLHNKPSKIINVDKRFVHREENLQDSAIGGVFNRQNINHWAIREQSIWGQG